MKFLETLITLSLALFSLEVYFIFLRFSCLIWNNRLYSVSNLFSQVSKTIHNLNCAHQLGVSDLSSSFSERVDTTGGKENQFADIVRLSRVTLVSSIYFASRHERDDLIHFPVIEIKLM